MLPLRDRTGGVYVMDVESEKQHRFVADDLENGVFSGRIASLHLRAKAAFTAEANFIRLAIDVEDERGRDRPLVVSFRLPIQAEGWPWDEDIRKTMPIQSGREYRVGPTKNYQGLAEWCSLYPWGCLADGSKLGLAVAIPPESPRIARIAYDEAGYLSLNFEIAVSPLTANFPSKANVELILYHIDPQWGFRSAARRYFDFYPWAFSSDAPRDGGWMCFAPEQCDAGRIDPALGADLASYFRYRLAFGHLDRLQGQYGLKEASFLCGVVKLRADDLSQFVDNRAYRDAIAAAADGGILKNARFSHGSVRREYVERLQASLMWDHDQNAVVGENWTGNNPPMISYFFNPSPMLLADVSDPPETLYTHYVDMFAQRLRSYPTLGIYCDVIGEWCWNQNYRTEHWRYALYPLSYDFKTKKVTQVAVFPLVEFFKRTQERFCRDRPSYLWVNGAKIFKGGVTWPAMYADVLGFEYGAPTRHGQITTNLIQLTYIRTIGYRKPIVHTNNTTIPFESADEYFAGNAEVYYARYAFHGVAFINRSVFTDRRLRAQHAEYIRTYLPVANRLAAAGWEPIPHARSDQQHVFVERYGNSPAGGIYVAVLNSKSQPTAFRLSIDAESLGFESGRLVATSLMSGETWPRGSTQIQATLKPYRLDVLKLSD